MSEQRILWLDLETTGLDPKNCVILEAAAVVTDLGLNRLGGASFPVKQSANLLTLESMGEWCFTQHGKSGLINDCLHAEYSLHMVESALLTLPLGHKPYLAGNSIHFDRSFLAEHMPRLLSALHHRQIDVSTLNVLAESWGRSELKLPKAEAHRAKQDIEESIKQASKYASELF